MTINQTYVKRQRLNPLSEQEFFEETKGDRTAERSDSRPTIPRGGRPSTSQIQALERQQRTEVSSFRAPPRQIQEIKQNYREIKARNEKMKAQSYAHYLRMASTNQTRLMLAFDIKEGKM